jgi:hypothetical protein
MRRKIVQLAAAHTPVTDDFPDGLDRLFALCDDGSVWVWRPGYANVVEDWLRLPDIPQDTGK